MTKLIKISHVPTLIYKNDFKYQWDKFMWFIWLKSYESIFQSYYNIRSITFNAETNINFDLLLTD